MSRHFAAAAVVASALSFMLSSCGTNDSQVNSRPAAHNTPTARDCEGVWRAMQVEHRVGDFTRYRNTSESKYGEYTSRNVTEDKQTVLANSGESIKLKYEVVMTGLPTQVSESVLYHSQVVQACEQAPETTSPTEVESGRETVTVPAGTFDTSWSRFKITQNDMNTDIKSYMTRLASGRMLLVKSVSHTEMSYGTSDTERILLETNKN